MSEGKSVAVRGSVSPELHPDSPSSEQAVKALTMTQRMSVENLMMQVWTSLPVTAEGAEGRDARMEMVRHLQGSDADKGSELIGKDAVPVTHFLVHRVTLVDDDGAEVEADRCVLIGPNGESWAFVSDGIRKSITLLCASLGVPPYDPPLRIRIAQTNTRRGRRLYQLIPVVESKKAKK